MASRFRVPVNRPIALGPRLQQMRTPNQAGNIVTRCLMIQNSMMDRSARLFLADDEQ